MNEDTRKALEMARGAMLNFTNDYSEGEVGSLKHYAREMVNVLAAIDAALAQNIDEPCFCDRTGLGAPGVSCGDCPTRDYKKPAGKPVAQGESVAQGEPVDQHARDSAELRRLCAERDRLRKALSDKRAIFQAGRDSYETACSPMNSDEEAWQEYVRAHGITKGTATVETMPAAYVTDDYGHEGVSHSISASLPVGTPLYTKPVGINKF